jgi:RNA polymerase sigma-70 factor (ECF subfamily)
MAPVTSVGRTGLENSELGSAPRATDTETIELIDRHRRGDPTAFEAIVTAYSSSLFTMAFRMMGNREDAEDLHQEVLLKVHSALGKFRGESSLRTWIFRIAVNAARNRVRWWNRLKRGHPISLDAVDADARPYADRIADPKPGPEGTTYGSEIQERVQQELDQLPWNQRMVVVLRDIDGMEYREIARTLEISLGTVKSRLARGRDALRHALADLLE